MYEVVDIYTFNQRVSRAIGKIDNEEYEKNCDAAQAKAVGMVLNEYQKNGLAFVQMTDKYVFFKKATRPTEAYC